jgi:toxin ParE1/3/4
MSRYFLRPSAETDLEEIWRYTVENWGEKQAERYLNDIRKTLEHAVETPSAGRRVEIGGRVYRMRRSGSHQIFYRETPRGIDVLRVLHARMDFARHLR